MIASFKLRSQVVSPDDQLLDHQFITCNHKIQMSSVGHCGCGPKINTTCLKTVHFATQTFIDSLHFDTGILFTVLLGCFHKFSSVFMVFLFDF